MTNNLPKLERFDTWIENDYLNGANWISKHYNSTGDFIEVADLIYWIQTHVREGTISTIYSDLLKALGEGGKQ